MNNYDVSPNDSVTVGRITDVLSRFAPGIEVVVRLPDGDIVPLDGMTLLVEPRTRSAMIMLLASSPEDKH